MEIRNGPGLKAVAYRIGTYSQFRDSLLACLSSSNFSSLRSLTTRDPSDFTVGLLDAWAAAADVLTFYQERIVNESFLRTATERRSVLELARLVGYRLSPGVAASAYLAFTLEEPPATSAANESAPLSDAAAQMLRRVASSTPESVVIDVGTKVQSVPGPDEKAQTYETTEKIEARPEWNAMKPLLTYGQSLTTGTDPMVLNGSILLKGISLQLRKGDRLLISVHGKRFFPQILSVKEDLTAQTTKVTLVLPSATKSESETPVSEGATSFEPKLVVTSAPKLENAAASLKYCELMAISPAQTKQSVLEQTATCLISQADISALMEGTGLSSSDIRLATGLRQLAMARLLPKSVFAMRVCASLFGHNAPPSKRFLLQLRRVHKDETLRSDSQTEYCLQLDAVYSQITPGDWVVVVKNGNAADPTYCSVVSVSQVGASGYGMSARVTQIEVNVVAGPRITIGSMGELGSTVVYAQSESLTLADRVRDEAVGGCLIELGSFYDGLSPGQAVVVAGEPEDPPGEWCGEVGFLKSAEHNAGLTVLTLIKNLDRKYKRSTATVNANVALATHGETVYEILGSGDATVSFQSFTLKQPPLTYVSVTTPSGIESTLEVRVNDILWKEVKTFLDCGPNDRVYVTRNDDDGKTVVQFGNGIAGSRLPTGVNNVTAKYRKGIGLAGLVKQEQLKTLLTKPLGVKEAINPCPASGGDDPESRDLARTNAPSKVRTLGRVVSLRDYEDFSRSFAGVAKALAIWAWVGQKRGVFITIAEPKGGEPSPESTLMKHLKSSLQEAGNPFAPIRLEPYRKIRFRIALSVEVLAEYLAEKVLSDVDLALRSAFSFESRCLGQPVFISEVMATVQSVPGVKAVDIDTLYRIDKPAAWNDRLPAALPEVNPDGSFHGAELLVLDSGPLDKLGVMS
jgi:hypothetical protein